MSAALDTGGGKIWDFVFNRRNKWLASPKFQAWAAKFPFTRRIARREAKALFDLCAGFVYAQVLRGCVELDLFELLAAGPLSTKNLALRCGLEAPAMGLLLNAAAALRLLEAAGPERFRLGPLGAALRGNPGIAAMVMHHKLFYDDLADPVALLRGQRTTALGQFWPYRGSAGQSAEYSALMAASQPFITREVLGIYDFARHNCVLDIGGGDGSFLTALHKQAPRLGLTLFELPEVAEQARTRFAQAGLGQLVAVFGGDFTRDSLPDNADLITMIRVLHDHDDDAAMQVLRAAKAALPPGGTLLVAEPMAGNSKADPVGDAYFSFYLLAMGSGRPRRFAEIAAMLNQAGFTKIRNIATRQPMLTGLITAQI